MAYNSSNGANNKRLRRLRTRPPPAPVSPKQQEGRTTYTAQESSDDWHPFQCKHKAGVELAAFVNEQCQTYVQPSLWMDINS